MNAQIFWVAFGKKLGGGYYPHSTADDARWFDSWLRDDFIALVLRVTMTADGVEMEVVKDK